MSGLRSSDATREQLSNYVGHLEPKFVKFQANNVLCAQRMPVHKHAEMVQSIVTGISVNSPQLIKQGFRADATTTHAQHFMPVHDDKNYHR